MAANPMPGLGSERAMDGRPEAGTLRSKPPLAAPWAAVPLRDRILFAATAFAWLLLLYLTWRPIPFLGSPAPDWSGTPDVTAPLTRKLLFYHPASAWASFAAYVVVMGASIAYLNERHERFDRAARTAAEVGFLFNTLALGTGTLWGIQEWSRSGQAPLATVLTEPKVLVVLVMWLAFAAYLTLRRLLDDPARRARLAAVFGILGFLGVPASFATSRILSTSLHPDVAGPGANPDAALTWAVAAVLAWSAVAFLLLFLSLWTVRLRLETAADHLAEMEARHAE